jgi:outer membrane protein assembly factor BamB
VRRLIIFLAVLAVLLAGILAAVAIHRLQQGEDVRGSSTEEFTLTTPPKRPLPSSMPWPTYGFDATRTRAVDLALRPPYRTVWRYYGGSLIEFPPVIGYGRLYFATNHGNLAAVNAETGKRAWIYRSGRCVAASPALGPNGSVYAVFMNKPPCNRASHEGLTGKVIQFAAGFGRIRWTKTIGPTESSPLLLGDRLYVGDWNGDVWALDAKTGRTIWRRRVGGAIKGALASAGGRLYVGAYDGKLYSFTRGGKVVWRSASQKRIRGRGNFYSTPALAYGRIYIGSTDGKVYSYGATSGKLRWSHSTGGYVYASPAVWRGLVLAGSYSKHFYAFDAATGDVRWTFTANGPISGSATVIGNVVYFATLKERTYALNARTGKQLWSFPDGKYTPAVATTDHLYLIGHGRVYGMVPR